MTREYADHHILQAKNMTVCIFACPDTLSGQRVSRQEAPICPILLRFRGGMTVAQGALCTDLGLLPRRCISEGGEMKHRKHVMGAVASFLATACLAAPATEEDLQELGSQAQGLDEQSIYPGRGYFLNLDTGSGDCLVPASFRDEYIRPDGTVVDEDLLKIDPVQAANTGGQEVIFALDKVESMQQLQDSLKISASAAANFLIGGGEAKFAFSESTHFAETSTTLVASIIVRNTSWTVPPGVKLHPEARDLLRTHNLRRFRERCGDGFVHSYTTGGEFYAVIQIEANNLKEKQDITSHVEGHYLTVEGSADFRKAMESLNKGRSITVTSYQVGGDPADTTPCDSVECVAERIDSFTTAALQKPVPFAVEVLNYGTLELPRDGDSPLDYSLKRDIMEDINARRNATRDLTDRLLDVQSRPERYKLRSPNATLAQVTSAISTLNANATKLDNALKACGHDPDTCSLPALTAVSIVPPPAKPSVLGINLLRSYLSPSTYFGFKDKTCGGPMQSFAHGVSAANRDALPGMSLVPGLIASNEADKDTYSFQPVSNPDMYVLGYHVLHSCHDVFLQGPLTSVAGKEMMSYYLVPGINGKPNTYSLRHFTTPGSPSSTPHNHDPNLYLTLHPDGAIEEDTLTATSSAERLDGASWYIEEL
jgi:hypothetical protein